MSRSPGESAKQADPLQDAVGRLVVLGAGRPHAGRAHSALRLVDRNRKVLDWILHAFDGHIQEVTFVGGYDAGAVAKAYPGMRLSVNSTWQQTGAAGSLFSLSFDQGADLYACYSDIVFRADAVEKLLHAGTRSVVVGVDLDSKRKSRTLRPDREWVRVTDGVVSGIGAEGSGVAAEFVGLIRVPREVLPVLHDIAATSDRGFLGGHLSSLVGELLRRGVSVEAVDLNGKWSDLENDGDLARFVFSNKAETLDRLRHRLRSATVPPQVRFTVGDWMRDPESEVAKVGLVLGTGPFAVRSSAASEDGFSESNAGRFTSLLNVSAEPAEISKAVECVIRSYPDRLADHQVFVQPMVTDVALSGVVLTRTGQVGGPYLTIAWSEIGGTDGITSGSAGDQQTIVVHRSRFELPAGANSKLAPVLHAVEEIEYLVDNDALDIEFAVAASGTVQILQVRPLVLRHERTGATDGAVSDILQDAGRRLRTLAAPPARQVGDRTIWGLMPDWNPAEMIGVRPRRLAFGLYAHLISDEIWATQRAEYGYRDVRPWPLIRQFAGQPYVDVRASFNSFLPVGVDDETAHAIVNAYLSRLAANPHLHDKIEFDVALTCWSFDFDGKLDRLAADALLPISRLGAFADGLRALTGRGIQRVSRDLQQCLSFDRSLQHDPGRSDDPLTDALALIERCRREGTLVFAHLARSAFIAVTLLRSAQRTGLLAEERVDAFLRSVRTVGHEFVADAYRVKTGTMPFAEFVRCYGHLRPGTYDLLSPAYHDAPEQFLAPIVQSAADPQSETFAWTVDEEREISTKLSALGGGVTFRDFDAFLRAAIEGRERAKFVFVRALSGALDKLTIWGEAVGLTRSDVGHLRLSDLFAVERGVFPNLQETLRARIEEAESALELACLVELPPLLLSADDIYRFEVPSTEPNFVTRGAAVAAPIFVDETTSHADLTGRIVVIPRADPGFDWIFGHGIAGLVTTFGGANSHMAIRAAEFSLPAAIGIGERRAHALRGASMIELNCRERILRRMEVQ